LRVRGPPHPHDYGAFLPPLAAESNDFPVMSDESGASQFLNSGGKFSLAPGFSPVMMVEKRRKAVLTASVCGETR